MYSIKIFKLILNSQIMILQIYHIFKSTFCINS